jgi:alkylation response protein AidB-like acyl-CoA dehydrogenase
MATAMWEEFGQAAEQLLTGVMRRAEVREGVAGGFSEEAWDLVSETGWSEVLVPEAEGGLGLGLTELGPIFKAVGRHLLPGPLLEHATLLPLLVAVKPAGAVERLAAMRAGTAKIAAPGLGLAQTRLPRLHGGRLNGSCAGVRYASLANELVVSCAVDGGNAVAIVSTECDGVGVMSRASLDPVVSVGDVVFEDVEVAGDETFGGEAATSFLARAISLQRLLIACELCGIAERTLELAVVYANEREQFGKPIGAFQAVQHLLAEAARRTHGLDCLCRESLEAADRSPEGKENIAIVAKAGLASASRAVVETSLQVHGGIAFTMEHALHGYYTHALGLEALHGSSRELGRQLGECLIEGGSSWPEW